MKKADFNRRELQNIHDEFYSKATYTNWNDYDIKDMSLPVDKPFYLKTVFGRNTLEELGEPYDFNFKE